MTLQPGTRVGPYVVVSPVGAGGMGEVWRATDSRLKRDVAIKVLPPAFTEDKERLARFEREAQLLAQLHHPNIASIFGLEETEGMRALVMEMVEGPTLAERLEAGPIPLDETLSFARQIAEALEEAHEKGIIHRDLKPQNVKVTPGGKVKVLDFGLAKAMDPTSSAPRSASSSPVSVSPTMSLGATAQGMILGTAAYMSPEQAKGAAVDRRADVWGFGVVVYEMLTGSRLFDAPTAAEMLALVLTRTPDLEALPRTTPAALKQLLRRCLDRNPRNRLHDIADARIVLDELASGIGATPSGETSAPAAPARDGSAPAAQPSAAARRSSALPWTVAALGAIAAVFLGAIALRRAPAAVGPHPLTTFGVLVPEGNALPHSQSPLLDISPDGRTLAFVAEGKDRPGIYLRPFDSMRIRRVAGSEGAEQPAFSPDGRWIAFFSGGTLKKVATEGGTPITLAEAWAPRGAAWAPDGTVIFSPVYSAALWRVASTGGEPRPVTKLDPARKERSHRWPQVLPDGRTVIFTVGAISRPGDYDDGAIDAVRLDTGERRTILEGARMARYTPTGHLVFQRRQALLAVRFDPVKLERLGEPFTIQEAVGGEESSGAGYFAVGAVGPGPASGPPPGILAFAPESAIPTERVLVLVDEKGRETELTTTTASYNHPRFSPDGKRIAYSIGSGSAADDDVYVLDVASGRAEPLTFGKGQGGPIWSPDGRRVFYVKGRSGDTGIASRNADGSGGEIQHSREAEINLLDAWLPDARHVVVTNTAGSLDLDVLDTKDGTTEHLYANPSAAEYSAAISPDGRYISYTTTDTGVDQVFVETYPKGGGKWRISTGIGGCPVWSRDGRRLYYVVDETVMVVDVETNGVFRAGPPRVAVTGPYELRTNPRRNFDAGPDGRLVLVKRKLTASAPHELVVLDGWTSLDPAAKPAPVR